MKAILIRTKETKKQTLGKILFFDKERFVTSAVTLELPFRDNKTDISSIPVGDYKVKKRYSNKYGNHFIITGVEGRDYILIHFGNFYHQTEGCVLVGTNYADINKDGHLDITSSRPTMNKLLRLVGDKFDLKVVKL